MINVLLLGDSITKGQYVNPSLIWATRAQTDEKLKNLGFHFYSSCVSGETSTRTLERLIVELESFPPDILFIQVGLNDANHWKTEGGKHPRTSPARFQANIEEMILRSKLGGVNRVIISTMHKVEKNIDCDGKPFDFYRGMYNEEIRKIAKNFEIDLFDLDKICLTDFKSEYLMPSPDLLHLSEAGHVWFYGYFRNFLISQNISRTYIEPKSSNFNLNTDWS
jgi:lysophospholipase L1-like esterase